VEEYLRPTRFLDFESREVVEYARNAVEKALRPEERTPKNIALALFYRVRDGIRYNPYRLSLDPEAFVASNIAGFDEGHCIVKAILLTACLRYWGIPARLGFANVRNHLSTPRFIEYLGTDIFAFHGYTDLFLNGRWLKATGAFNKSLCDKFDVAPLDFDGENDALFHQFDRKGNVYMEYVEDLGVHADFPYELMIKTLRKYYPQIFTPEAELLVGNFEAEIVEKR
jgi:transglutaminase-like putative cysteine protease